MPDRFFLNSLRVHDRTLAVPEAGAWRNDERLKDFLVKFSSDIHMEGQINDAQIIHSVPSVFARPIQFDQVFNDPNNPQHDALVTQWRGLMATIALHDWLRVDLRVEKYSIPAVDDIKEAMKATRVGGTRLQAVLRHQIPSREWEHFWLLFCDDKLIGATSPWTVFYTPAEYTCSSKIPWQEKGLLVDPIAFFDPEKKRRFFELGLLLQWVKTMLAQQEDWGMEATLEKKAGNIARELKAWRDDLQRHATTIESPAMVAMDETMEEPYRNFFQKLTWKESSDEASSDMLLKSSKGGSVLAFSRAGINPSKRVYRATAGRDVDVHRIAPSGNAGWFADDGKEIPYAYVVAEDVFLPPALVKLKLSKDALDRGASDYAIPLASEFFQYFDLADIQNHAAMLVVQEKQDKVVVRLTLPMRSGDPLRVEKTYFGEALIEEVEGGTPALALWPDYVASDWFENFAVWSATGSFEPNKQHLLGSPLQANGTVLTPVREGSSAEGDAQKPLRIWKNREALIGFALKVRTPDNGKETPAGLILRGRSSSLEKMSQSRTWKVAADFGTSNTYVAIQQEGEEPQPLRFEKRTVVLTQAASAAISVVASNFYPTEAVALPVPTLLSRSAATVLDGDGHSEYTPRYLIYPEAIEANKFVANVKWGAGGANYEDTPLREYLKGLVRCIACEARAAGVGQLVFEWSYPLSLPDHARAAMGDFWQSVAALAKTPNMHITVKPACTESEALCRLLAAAKVLPVEADALSIAVDVGGGSSDIGFWSSNTLLDQVSLKIAGNDLLVDWVGLESFAKQLYESCTRLTWDDKLMGPKFTQRPAILFNVVLGQAKNRDGTAFKRGDPQTHPLVNALFADLAQGQPPWSVVRSLNYLFYSGLAFYMGMHARKHIGKMKHKQIGIYFGGGGSSLLSWISGNTTTLSEALSKAFLKGLALDSDGKQTNPPLTLTGPAIEGDTKVLLKEEVVRGLLSAPLVKLDPAGRPVLDAGNAGEMTESNTTILGERGFKNAQDQPLEWDAELAAVDVYNLKVPANLNSSYMAVFLAEVLPTYVKTLSLDPKLLDLNVDAVQIQASLRRGSAGQNKVLQPIFAFELQSVMQSYIGMVSKKAVVASGA